MAQKTESNNNGNTNGYLDKELQDLNLDDDEYNFRSLTISQETSDVDPAR